MMLVHCVHVGMQMVCIPISDDDSNNECEDDDNEDGEIVSGNSDVGHDEDSDEIENDDNNDDSNNECEDDDNEDG